MKRTLCLSLTGRTARECMAHMLSCRADMFEHRMDFMDHIGDLDVIYDSSEKPIIAACRSTSQSGYFRGDESERANHLLEALSAGASYVDIELETSPSLRSMLQGRIVEADAQLILSKHYHGSTPSFCELVHTLDAMAEAGADIAKMVTTPHTMTDCITVLQLYSTAQDLNLPLLSYAMGDLGKFTRVCALLLGAPFMYVAQDDGLAAAPGQIPLSKMNAILEALE